MKQIISGYTLIEVLGSVFLVGILSTITLPSLSRLLAQNRLDNSIAVIFKSLHFARLHAVSHSTNISICPMTSGNCTQNWTGDIYIFEDSNGNLSLDNNEYVLKVVKQINLQDELNYPRKAITYRSDGSINFMQSGSFVYCNRSFPDLSGNQITVSQVGRIRIIDSKKCQE